MGTNYLNIDQVIIEDNESINGSGGGAYIGSANNLTFTNSIIRRNKTSGSGLGGGLVISSGSVNVNNLTISDNESTIAGGIYLRGVSGTIEKIRVTSNKAIGGAGSMGGGAVFKTSSAIVLRSLFSQNESPIGSGIAITESDKSSFSNIIVSGNRGVGSAILVTGRYTESDFIHLTISDNYASVGNSSFRVENQGRLTLRRTVVAHNKSGNSLAPFGKDASTIFTLIAVFVWDNSGPWCFDDPSDTQRMCGSVLVKNPMFLNRLHTSNPLAYQLKPDSEVIDYASPSVKYDFSQSQFPAPLEGPRPVCAKSRCDNEDIPDPGAFEYQNPHESTGKHFENQKIILGGWKGPNNDGDQQKALLHIIVKDEQGKTVIDDIFPQSNDGFYVLSGDYGWDPNKRYSAIVKPVGYLAKRLIKTNPKPPDTETLFRFPAYNSPAVEATLTPGDADGDNAVTLSDINQVLTNFTKTNHPADIDGDGIVGISDLNLTLVNFAKVGDSF